MCDPEDPSDCVEFLLPDQPAPFGGMLLGPRRAATITTKAEQCDERVKMAADEVRELGGVKLQAEKDGRASDNDASAQRLEIMQWGMDQYKERYAPKWYEHPVIWYALGILTAAGVTAGAVAIIDATRPTVITAQ